MSCYSLPVLATRTLYRCTVRPRLIGGDDLEHAAGDRPSAVRNGAAVGVVLIGILPISNRVLGDLHDRWRAMSDQECHEEV